MVTIFELKRVKSQKVEMGPKISLLCHSLCLRYNRLQFYWLFSPARHESDVELSQQRREVERDRGRHRR